MKRIMIVTLLVVLAGCTPNQMAKEFGGTETINLPKGQRLLMATWKGEKGAANLWYLTEPMSSDYTPQTKIFHESSEFGIAEGTVLFVESK